VAPEGQRIDVEVLPVQVHPFCDHQSIHVVYQPHARLRVAQVQQPPPTRPFRQVLAVAGGQQPLGLPGQPGARGDPLRFEPQDESHSLVVRMITDRAQPAWEALAIHFPGSGFGPGAAGIPAGIHPPEVERYVVGLVCIDEADFIALVALKPFKKTPCTGGQQRRHRPIHELRGVVGQHPAPPGVLCCAALTLPEHQDHARGAGFLSRLQPEVGCFLPAARADCAGRSTAEFNRPLPGPAEHDDHTARSLPRALEIEIRKAGLRGPAAGGCEAHRRAGIELGDERLVTVRRAVIALVMVESDLLAHAKDRIDGLDIA